MRRIGPLRCVATLVVALSLGCGTARASQAVWTVHSPVGDLSLRGLSAVSRNVAWASGPQGTWARTIDGGATWYHGQVDGAETLDFRDVEAFDGQTALLLSIASPGRIYRTDDGGADWTLVYEDARPEIFFNSIGFADPERGYAVGDPIDGRFQMLSTDDGGRTWSVLESDAPPEPAAGEAQFAASGTILAARDDHVWIATGGSVARIHRSQDRGRTWRAYATPLQQGSASQGAFSIGLRSLEVAIVVGGDYTREDVAAGTLAVSTDGGASWRVPSGSGLTGFRSAVVHVPGTAARWVAVGPLGTDVSADDGVTWRRVSDQGFHVVAAAPDGAIWAAGRGGHVARMGR